MSSALSPDRELARLRRVLQLESAGTWDWDLRTQEMTWDRGHRLLFGVSETARITPEFFLTLLHADDRAPVEAVFYEAVRTRQEYEVDYRIVRPVDGEERWIEARGYFEFEGETPVRSSGLVLDATERRERQRLLDRQRDSRVYHAEQFALLFDKNPAPMWVFDCDTLRFLEVNEAAVAAYGWSRDEFLTMTIMDIRPESVRERFSAQLPARLVDTESELWSRHCTRDGTERVVHVVASNIEWEGHRARLVIARDETARLQLEERSSASRRMEAIGQLAGGIAHDFNNLLTVLIGAVEFARQHTGTPENLEHDLDDIETAAARARALVAQLLAFSKRQTLQIRSLNLNELIRRAEPMLRRVAGEPVEVHIALDPREPVVQGDAGQIEQMLLALAFNARDACIDPDASHRPELKITTQGMTHGVSEVHEWPGLAVGDCVELCFRDTGRGMPPEVLAHAFEPFFTTKPVGSAHGLGLSTVLGIMQQMGGAVRLESAPGAGTTVRLRFPRQTEVAPRRLSGSQPAISETKGTALLAEDDPSVRTAIRRMLQGLGYQVIEAPDGAVALATWRAHRADVDVIVTDIRMPRLNGRDLAAAVRREAPEFPIVFASGYTDEGLAEATAFDRFLDKPFTSARLKEALEAVRAPAP